MGREAICTVEFAGRTSEGRALLETNEILFRGDFRLKIPRGQIKNVQVSDGKLVVKSPEGTAVFHLGSAAQKWAAKILNPPSRLDKLGVKSGTTYQAIGTVDGDFLAELKQRGAKPRASEPDIIFLVVNVKSELTRMPKMRAGELWIVYPKGVKAITENDVLAAGRKAGLVDVKVASFSATHTALKFLPSRAAGKGAG